MLFEFSARWNLLIAVGGAIFCLYPLIQLDEVGEHTTDDDNLIFGMPNGIPLQRSISLLASFFVVLIPAADLMLDWPSQMKSFLFPVKRPSKKTVSNFHMNEHERLVFMIGVASQASVWLLPVAAEPSHVAVVYVCADNFSAILILAAMLCYLQRCTITFTPLRTTAIINCAVIGQMIGTVRQSFRSDLPTFRMIGNAAMTCVGITSMVFVSMIMFCACKHIRKNYKVHSILKTIMTFHVGVPSCSAKKSTFDYDHELFTNIIPALHMTSSLMILAAGYYVYFTPKERRRTAYERKDYVVLIAEILILVIELRIRKNEVARILVRHSPMILFNCCYFLSVSLCA